MSNNNQIALKSGVWYTVGNFVAKAAGFIATPIFTRLLTTEEVGDFTNFSSWISIISTIVTLELCTSVALAKFDYEDNIDDFIFSNLLLGSVITTFVYLLAVLNIDFFCKILLFSKLELHIAFIYLLTYPAIEMFLVRSRIYYKYKISIFISLLAAFLSMISSLVCTILFEEKIIGRLFGYYFPLAVIDIAIYIYFFVKHKGIRKEYWIYALKISGPLIIHRLAGSVLGASDRIMITRYCGKEYTAMYGVAAYCAMIVSLIWTSMNSAWSPWAFEQMNENNTKEVRKASKKYIVFFLFIVVLFLLFGPEILLIMGGSSYTSAKHVVPPMMIAFVFQFIYSLYVNIETFYKKQIMIAFATAFAAGVNIVLNAIFIPQYGYQAAAYTTLISYMVLLIAHYIVVRVMGKEKYYSSCFNAFISLCSLLVMFFIQWSYEHYIFRIIFIEIVLITLCIFTIIKKKEITSYIKKIIK